MLIPIKNILFRMNNNSRRHFLVAGSAALAGFAGCAGSEDSETPSGPSGSDYPAVDEWLTETDVGEADSTYEGQLADERDTSSIQIAVGSPGNGGNYAFDPSAVVVSSGTEVIWEWTGKGQAHNVEAEPDGQLGKSDYEFTSGEPVEDAGTSYTKTLDESGVALYHCEPHLALGMKGGIAVE
jgi:halocyanin-like protein